MLYFKKYVKTPWRVRIKKIRFSLVCIGVIVFLSSCGQKQEAQKNEEVKQKIALVLKFGGVDDRSFNQAGKVLRNGGLLKS